MEQKKKEKALMDRDSSVVTVWGWGGLAGRGCRGINGDGKNKIKYSLSSSLSTLRHNTKTVNKRSL